MTPEKKFKSVLVVDDDPAALFLATKLLRRMALAETIRTAANGLEAFLLIDLKMPVMNGFKLIEALEGLDLPARPLVAVLTSSENTIDREKARNLRTDGYLLKPIRQEALEQLLAELRP